MPKRDLAAEVQEIIARELGRNPAEINQKTDLGDLDDLKITEIILALEEKYGIIVPESDHERLLGPGITEFEFEPEPRVIKVSDLVAIIREQLSRQRPHVLSSQSA